MPVYSMTGYATAHSQAAVVEGQPSTGAPTLGLEIRSVNSRFLDLKWRLPLFLRPSEAALERVVREQVARGRLEVHLEFSPKRTDMWKATLDTGLASAMLNELDALEALPLPDLLQRRYERLRGYGAYEAA